MDIGANLDRVMKLNGIKTQVELSRLSGISQSTINRILQNKGSTDVATLKALAEVCNVQMIELLSEGQNPDIPITNLSPREIRLITAFRASSQEGQEIIIASAEVAASLSHPPPSKNPHE